MIETVAEHCKHKDCKYRSIIAGSPACAYILIAGHSRKCSISDCDKYDTGKIMKKSTKGGIYYFEE